MSGSERTHPKLIVAILLVVVVAVDAATLLLFFPTTPLWEKFYFFGLGMLTFGAGVIAIIFRVRGFI